MAAEIETVTTLENESVQDASIDDSGPNFFERNTEERKEIVEGLFREQQLVAFAGPYGIGKSPMLADVAMHVLTGKAWCGRAVQKRPVIHMDLETPGPVYKANLRNIATRLGVPLPKVPEELDVYLEHEDPTEAGTKKLLAALALSSLKTGVELIEKAVQQKPNALIVIDPLELLFRIDTGKKQQVLSLYAELRRLLSRFPHSGMLISFNLRKRDKKAPQPDLLTDPRGWLEEVCGTLDILNRSDVRLGIDLRSEDMRVINGIRRGEEMHPSLIHPMVHDDKLAGFELCPPDTSVASVALTSKQREYWQKLPTKFRFDEVADKLVPRATLKRLIDRAKSLGALVQENGLWQKVGFG